MHIAPAALLATIVFSTGSLGQTPAPPQEAAPAAALPSFASLLHRPLGAMEQTLSDLNTARWKRGTVRDEAQANIDDIRRDLRDSLPPVLAAADAAPASLTKALPLSRHVDLLYDVLLRVVEAARLLGSPDDAGQLQQELVDLGSARRALNQRLMDLATAQEKQIGDLKVELQTEIAAAARAAQAPPPPPPPAAATTAAHKPKKKTPAKPAQTKPTPAKPTS